MEQHFFAAIHREKSVEKASSSGGAFTAITDQWFVQYGNKAVIYGCVLDAELRAKHIRAERPEDRNRMRGSKYIGSDLTGIFRLVAEDLERENYVVFSGTPCQIGGLTSFLKVKGICNNDRLLTVEVICHGVGSVRFFYDYIHELERRYRSKAIACYFRAKSRPGKKQDMMILFDNEKSYQASSTRFDWFYSAYLNNVILRPSCYQCKYACRERIADISIADHWGDSAGEIVARSLIIANTEQGIRWVTAARNEMQMEEISWQQVHQPHMLAPCEKPKNYEQFWTCYREEGYLAVQKLLGNHTLKGYLRSTVVELLYRLHLIELVKCTKGYLRKQ